ncbi:MAG: flagellar filament capping protein FliD [Planctomycetota bacterium]
MSNAGISFGGLASGLDTKAIIQALVAIERRPIAALEQKKTSLGKQKSLFGDLRGLLGKLETAAKALKTTSDFLVRKASSDKEEIVTASAGSAASAGTYNLRVVSLAKAQVNASSGSASPSASLGAPGTLQLDVGGATHFIAVGGVVNGVTEPPTLERIAAAINAADDANATGVRAEVVDTGNSGNNRYQLVVRSEQAGTASGFSISYDDGDPAFQAVINSVGSNVLTQASDARVQLNGGVTDTRASNPISDLIAGVTLELKSDASPTQSVAITVSNDSTATTKKVQDFVDAYNKVVDFLADQNQLDADGKAKGPLFGDSTLRALRAGLRTIAGSAVPGTGNASFQLLSQLGVKADTAGKLTLTATALAEALATDEAAVAAVFTSSANGIAGRVVAQIDVYTDSVDGLIKNRTEAFDRQSKDATTRITQAERRLTSFEKQLEQKYANLEQLMGRLQSQGSSLGAFFSRR